MKNLMRKLGLSSVLLFGLLGVGCGGGGGGHSGGHAVPVIIIHGGLWGYYNGPLFCCFTNNYCGSGLAYGITGNGCNYNGQLCSSGVSIGGSGGGLWKRKI